MTHRISDADVSRFTEGDCHIFAREMSRVTGWRIAVFTTEDGDTDLHAFVVSPSGPVDILGVHSWHDFRVEWKCKRWRFITWDELHHDWGGPCVSSWSPRRAKQLVPMVLDAAGINLDTAGEAR